MPSIFSTQNLHTFLRRKNFRPPSRGPPGPPGRGPVRGPRGPPSRGPPCPPSRPPPSGRGAGASAVAAPAAGADVLFTSSAMLLLMGHSPLRFLFGLQSLALSRFSRAPTMRERRAVPSATSVTNRPTSRRCLELRDIFREQLHGLCQSFVAPHQSILSLVNRHFVLRL